MKWLAILFFAVSNVCANSSNSTIWEQLGDAYNGPMSNSTIYYSLLNSTKLMHLAVMLNSTSQNSTLFVPSDSSIFEGRPAYAGSKVAAHKKGAKGSGGYQALLRIPLLNASILDYMHYQIAMEGYSPDSAMKSTVLHTHLTDPAFVNLSTSNPTTTNCQVVVIDKNEANNSTCVLDGTWPPVNVTGYSAASNGAIVYVDRPLEIPRPLSSALAQNQLYGFSRKLAKEKLLKPANSAAGITVFALGNVARSKAGRQPAASFLVHGVYYNFNGQNTTLTSWNGRSLEIVALPDNRIAVNGTMTSYAQVLLSNGVMYMLSNDSSSSSSALPENQKKGYWQSTSHRDYSYRPRRSRWRWHSRWRRNQESD